MLVSFTALSNSNSKRILPHELILSFIVAIDINTFLYIYKQAQRELNYQCQIICACNYVLSYLFIHLFCLLKGLPTCAERILSMLRRWCSLPCWNSTFHYTWRLQQSLAQSRVSEVRMQTDIGYNSILYNQNIWLPFYFGSLANHVNLIYTIYTITMDFFPSSTQNCQFKIMSIALLV